MNLASLSENKKIEKRLAITPEITKKYLDLGFNLFLPNNYGSHLGFDDNDYKTISLIEKLIKKKINRTTLDKIIFSQKSKNQNTIRIKQKNKKKPKPILLPEENYLNFKESGKIPDFLNKNN